MLKLGSSRGIRIDVPVLSVSWSVVDHSVIIQALKKGLIEHEASDTGGVPRWKSSRPDRLAEATLTCFTTATMMPANTLTLCISYGLPTLTPEHYTVTKCWCKLLVVADGVFTSSQPVCTPRRAYWWPARNSLWKAVLRGLRTDTNNNTWLGYCLPIWYLNKRMPVPMRSPCRYI